MGDITGITGTEGTMTTVGITITTDTMDAAKQPIPRIYRPCRMETPRNKAEATYRSAARAPLRRSR